MLSVRRRIDGFVPYATTLGKTYAIAAAVVLAAHWALILRFVATREALAYFRLHYSVAYGIDWLDRWWLIFTYPFLALAAYAGTLLFAERVARHRKPLGTVLLASAVPVQAAFLAAGSIAILLNS